MKKGLLIVNPHSGKKNGEREAARIREEFTERNFEISTFVSNSINELVRFVEECSFSDFEFVGLVGGDGTMHEFLNAALRRYDHLPLPIALFPCGTGNAFNYDIGC